MKKISVNMLSIADKVEAQGVDTAYEELMNLLNKYGKKDLKVVKNKVAPPFRTAEFDIIFGKGISKTGNILDVAVNLDIVKKAGAWFSYNEEKLGQGREKAKEFLDANPEILAEVERLVREKLENQ